MNNISNEKEKTSFFKSLRNLIIIAAVIVASLVLIMVLRFNIVQKISNILNNEKNILILIGTISVIFIVIMFTGKDRLIIKDFFKS